MHAPTTQNTYLVLLLHLVVILVLTADVTSFLPTQASFDLDTGTLTVLVSCLVELLSDQNTLYNFTFHCVENCVSKIVLRKKEKIDDFICVTRNLWNMPMTH